MLIDLLRNCTLFLFWLFAFGVMLVIDICAIAVACYMLRQFGEEWAKTVERGRRRHGYQPKAGAMPSKAPRGGSDIK